jgi:DNA-binding response OmpR family regulator
MISTPGRLAERPSSRTDSCEPESTSMQRILIVDDDPSFRTVLRMMLVKQGYDVIEAGDGNEALELMETGGADVVVTDLIMPEKEGLETIQELRNTHPTVKVIAMSGGGDFTGRDILAVARILGAHSVLAKPFTSQQIAAALDAVLDRAA